MQERELVSKDIHHIWLHIAHIKSVYAPRARFEIGILWVPVNGNGIANVYSLSEESGKHRK